MKRGETVAPFEQTSFNLDLNQIKTEYGYHLIQPLGEIKPDTPRRWPRCAPRSSRSS